MRQLIEPFHNLVLRSRGIVSVMLRLPKRQIYHDRTVVRNVFCKGVIDDGGCARELKCSSEALTGALLRIGQRSGSGRIDAIFHSTKVERGAVVEAERLERLKSTTQWPRGVRMEWTD